MSFLIALSDVMPFEYKMWLEDSSIFRAIFAKSLPSDESLDECLKVIWELWSHLAAHANWSTYRFLFDDLTQRFVTSIIPFITSKCVMETRPGALRVSQSFGLFEPLIQKIVTVTRVLTISKHSTFSTFHSIYTLLCGLMGAESLETRQCVLLALCGNLDGFRLGTPLPEWFVSETTPFSVNSDGTLKGETLLGKCSILLTESMNAIDTLLDDVCDDNVKTLSNHCRLVASTFSCLALLGRINEEPFEILMSKGVLQQIGAWAGSLLNTPPSPTRNEALLSLVQILVYVQSYSPPAELISLDLVFPESTTPLADLLALIEPLINIDSDKVKTVIAQFLLACSLCCQPDSEDTSLLFTFFNKFVDSEGFIDVDFDEDQFHRSIIYFLLSQRFDDDSPDPNPLDTPSLRAYLHQFFLSHGRTNSKLHENVSYYMEEISGAICLNMTSLLFWKDVGGVVAIVHALTLEDRSDSDVGIFKAIYKNILFPEGSVMTSKHQTLVLRELEEEGFSDAVEMDTDYSHVLNPDLLFKPNKSSVPAERTSFTVLVKRDI
ncbi:hypothetical protein BLNAU_13938 [Blattamonas nauphoetae]|uniref:Uncharacterized protein n=1 Tax=Blattamonas nauphoetae TaxID=2049346 RepID=A0ABQ9XI32_9EUKA|nr:hypothetical protein BLNAU_13938 [Blattamonas nauphoetae]